MSNDAPDDVESKGSKQGPTLDQTQIQYIINNYYESFLKIRRANPCSGRAGSGVVNDWVSARAVEIYDSEAFADIRPPAVDAAVDPKLQQAVVDAKGRRLFARDLWQKRIRKKFHNLAGRKAAHEGATSASTSPANGASLFVRQTLTGRQLFQQEHEDDISEAVASKTKGGCGNIGHYQTCLRELWDALPLAEREKYNERATTVTPAVVEENQKHFNAFMHSELEALSQSGMCGDMEIVLLYGFRNPNGAVDTGEVHVHGGNRSQGFHEKHESVWKAATKEFQKFSKTVIPENSNARTAADKVEIPRNTDGVPVFPPLDTKTMAIATIIQVLKAYLTELHRHSRPDTSMSWDVLSYDTAKFALPVRIRDPDLMSVVEVIQVVEYFIQLSGDDSQAPFTFATTAASTGNKTSEADGKKKKKNRRSDEDGGAKRAPDSNKKGKKSGEGEKSSKDDKAADRAADDDEDDERMEEGPRGQKGGHKSSKSSKGDKPADRGGDDDEDDESMEGGDGADERRDSQKKQDGRKSSKGSKAADGAADDDEEDESMEDGPRGQKGGHKSSKSSKGDKPADRGADDDEDDESMEGGDGADERRDSQKKKDGKVVHQAGDDDSDEENSDGGGGADESRVEQKNPGGKKMTAGAKAAVRARCNEDSDDGSNDGAEGSSDHKKKGGKESTKGGKESTKAVHRADGGKGKRKDAKGAGSKTENPRKKTQGKKRQLEDVETADAPPQKRVRKPATRGLPASVAIPTPPNFNDRRSRGYLYSDE